MQFVGLSSFGALNPQQTTTTLPPTNMEPHWRPEDVFLVQGSSGGGVATWGGYLVLTKSKWGAITARLPVAGWVCLKIDTPF